MLKNTINAALIAAATLFGSPAFSSEFEPAMRSYLETEILTWATDPVILDALRAANAVTAGYDDMQIDALDKAWRSEVGAADTPTMTPVLTNAAAAFLRDQVKNSGGMISEIFIMDQVGLNVAASGVTSDMWQGDEEKFTQTYGVGVDAVHIGEVELDESTQQYLGQISLTITDPATGEALGAMTIGLNAEMLL